MLLELDTFAYAYQDYNQRRDFRLRSDNLDTTLQAFNNNDKRNESRNLTPSAERGKETIIPPSFRLSIKVSMRMLRGNCTTTASTIMIRIQELISARLQ